MDSTCCFHWMADGELLVCELPEEHFYEHRSGSLSYEEGCGYRGTPHLLPRARRRQLRVIKGGDERTA